VIQTHLSLVFIARKENSGRSASDNTALLFVSRRTGGASRIP
jgi:hypothetical protein